MSIERGRDTRNRGSALALVKQSPRGGMAGSPGGKKKKSRRFWRAAQSSDFESGAVLGAKSLPGATGV